jgi:predicted DsbA family dithiol-disulfide isomerase
MGGLLPSWDNYKRGSISKPEDAAAYWLKAAEISDMPINHGIWLEHPLTSSYPPSIAFKAAQLQDTDKAIIFLRRINEMLFVDNQNIVDLKLLYNAAYEAGLDASRFLRDMSGRAPELFQADLSLAEELSISVLPTFIFTDKFNNSSVLKGFQEYETFENMVLNFIPNATKKVISKDYHGLFNLYPTLTTKEFSFLSDLGMAQSENLLKELELSGIIKKSNSHLIGNIWKMKSSLPMEN